MQSGRNLSKRAACIMGSKVLPDFTTSRPIHQPIFFLANVYFSYAVEVIVHIYKLFIIIIIIIITICTNKYTNIYIYTYILKY